ncbi:MAG: hypothetical protein Pg6C_18210 [Treponemataceae bacterium]|nr:MAG: hypothetical protein Pg6C_18210 [Treponemataceae bacterium]
MNSNFIAVVEKVVSDRGKTAVQNKAVFNSLLADYCRGKFVRERRLFMRELSRKTYDQIMRESAPPPTPAQAPVPVYAPEPEPMALPPASRYPVPAPVEAKRITPVKELKNYGIYELNLSARLRDIFDAAGFETVYDVLVKTPVVCNLEKSDRRKLVATLEQWFEKKNIEIDWDEVMRRVEKYKTKFEERQRQEYSPAKEKDDVGDILAAAAIGGAIGLGIAALLG